MPRLATVLLLLFPSLAFAQLEIGDAWIKNLPASVPVRAGYMAIHNPTRRTLTIVGARSEAFAGVEFHRSLLQDGVMRMEPVTKLVVEAGGSARLAPGGLHLMMMQPVEPTRRGQIVRVVLSFDDGGEQQISMEVRR